MVPTLEGEFARKRRMMVGLWDIVVARGDALAARLPAALRVPDRLPPPAALPDARCCTCRAGRPTSRCSGEGRVYTVTLALQVALLAAALLGRFCRWRRCGSPATTCSSPPRSRPGSGTGCARGRPAPGRRRRGRGEPGAGPASSRPLALLLCSPLLALAAVAIRLDGRGPVIYRQRRVGLGRARVRAAEAAHDGRGLRPGRRRHRGRPRRPARDPGRARSCAASRSTRSRTWSTSCAARCRSSGRARRSRPRSTTTRPTSAAASR